MKVVRFDHFDHFGPNFGHFGAYFDPKFDYFEHWEWESARPFHQHRPWRWIRLLLWEGGRGIEKRRHDTSVRHHHRYPGGYSSHYHHHHRHYQRRIGVGLWGGGGS